MVKASSSERIMETKATEQHDEPVMANQTEVEAEIARDKILDRPWHSPSLESQITKAVTERAETEASAESLKEFPQDEDAEKNRRARANALMDMECLGFLKLFCDKEQLMVDELSNYVTRNKDWLKIALLIRADYLQSLDSTVRITLEGLEAWTELNRLQNLSKLDT